MSNDFLPYAPHDGTPVRYWTKWDDDGAGDVVQWGPYDLSGGAATRKLIGQQGGPTMVLGWVSEKGLACFDPDFITRWEIA